MSNIQIVKGGPAVGLILAQSAVAGLSLAAGQWCAAQVENGAATLWEGPGTIPAAGAANTIGSGTLSALIGGGYSIQYAILSVGTATEHDSQVFLNIDDVLYGSQMFDLVDTAASPPAPIPVPSLVARGSLENGVPTINLSGF